MQLFSIGDIAKLFQVKTSAIRYYCDIGLLIPVKVDPQTGYRYFTTQHLEQLNTIKYLQALGLSLDAIQQFLYARDPNELIEQLIQQRHITEQKITELQHIQQTIDRRIVEITAALITPTGKVMLRYLPKRSCLFLEQNLHQQADLELAIRALENKAGLHASVFLGKIGVRLAETSLRSDEPLIYDGIFLLLEQHVVDNMLVLPAGTYATIRFHGKHADAAPYYEQLLQFIHDEQLTINGQALEITYIDDGLSQNPQQFMTEIQLPLLD